MHTFALGQKCTCGIVREQQYWDVREQWIGNLITAQLYVINSKMYAATDYIRIDSIRYLMGAG